MLELGRAGRRRGDGARRHRHGRRLVPAADPLVRRDVPAAHRRRRPGDRRRARRRSSPSSPSTSPRPDTVVVRAMTVQAWGRVPAMSASYLLDNQAAEAGRPFDAPVGRLRRVDVPAPRRRRPGRRLACWEVGAGGPRMPRWLAEPRRTDRQGAGDRHRRDVDVRDRGRHRAPPRRRRRPGAAPAASTSSTPGSCSPTSPSEPPRCGAWPARCAPAGWLVVEDFDVSAQPLACPDAADDDEERANRVRAGLRRAARRPVASTSASGARCATACARSGLADVGPRPTPRSPCRRHGSSSGPT